MSKIGLVESWGTGVKRILDAAQKYGLPTPDFQAFDDMFRVNLFRNVLPMEEQGCIGETSKKHQRSIGEALEKHQNNPRNNLNATQRQILELLSQDVRLSVKRMAETIGISSRNVEANIKKLKECGILVRHGSPKNGYWEVLE